MTNIFNKGFDKIIKFAQTEDMGHVLNVTGTLGWALSCMAYTGAILFNKGIPSDQKKFLVPQELADGVINVSLFWLITSKFNKIGQKLVNEGKVLPNALKERVLEIRAKHGKDLPLETFEKHLKESGHIGKFREFQRSFPALISITGSVIAANIVTPIVRNFVASKFQKKHIHNDAPVLRPKTVISQQQRPTNIVKPLNVSSYSTGVQGQMKI